MNYLKIYEDFILDIQSKNRKKINKKDLNYVLHHIMPKCLGGNNDDENLILLTNREHYFVHKCCF